MCNSNANYLDGKWHSCKIDHLSNVNLKINKSVIFIRVIYPTHADADEGNKTMYIF